MYVRYPGCLLYYAQNKYLCRQAACSRCLFTQGFAVWRVNKPAATEHKKLSLPLNVRLRSFGILFHPSGRGTADFFPRFKIVALISFHFTHFLELESHSLSLATSSHKKNNKANTPATIPVHVNIRQPNPLSYYAFVSL